MAGQMKEHYRPEGTIIEGVIHRGEGQELRNILTMAIYVAAALSGGLAIAIFAIMMAYGALQLIGSFI